MSLPRLASLRAPDEQPSGSVGNVAVGLIWTIAIVTCAVTGVLGANGALLAALLQNLSILIVMFNAGRLLKFQELLEPPGQAAG